MNLWPEFDEQNQNLIHNQENAPLVAENARAGRARRTPRQKRRPTEQAVLSSVREWLAQDYLASYCRALSAMPIYSRCYWIDTWSGDIRVHLTSLSSSPHSSEITSPDIPDVPALHQASDIPNTPNAPNADNSRKSRKTLQQKNEFALPKKHGVVRANWSEVAPELLNAIEQSPAIFLLNPFGQTLLSYDDVLPIYQRTTAPTELCLLVPHRQAEQHLTLSSQNAISASALTALLRSDRWKALSELIAKGEEGQVQVIDGLLALFITSLQKHFLWVQRIELLMQMRPGVVEIAPYTLLFATRRKDSLACMNDAACLRRRRLFEQSHRGVLGEEWFEGQWQKQLAAERAQLRQRVLQQGQRQRVQRWPDLRQHLMLAHFGQFTVSEYDEIMQSLLQHGKVRCEWRQAGQAGRSLSTSLAQEKRIPGIDDRVIWE